ncbi:astacin [Teladorsagia circumcincta]|uniref:Metalloendopeptidase n=1 Tax=Teladorsagia circumcincta TaxID=45464 RepID=A0A2G9TJG8_TELCI|nr:astacin [Teladorsagia circumcincta]
MRKMHEVKEKMSEYKEKVWSTLVLSPEKEEELKNNLTAFKRKTVDDVLPADHPIDEVNMEQGIADDLYQGDMFPLEYVTYTISYVVLQIGTAAHELAHTLGFYHTQSRYDRDDYITVIGQNINQNYSDQFEKQTNETNNNYGLPYDYGSVMHYRATA